MNRSSDFLPVWTRECAFSKESVSASFISSARSRELGYSSIRAKLTQALAKSVSSHSTSFKVYSRLWNTADTVNATTDEGTYRMSGNHKELDNGEERESGHPIEN